jgi:hypothetical protein
MSFLLCHYRLPYSPYSLPLKMFLQGYEERITGVHREKIRLEGYVTGYQKREEGEVKMTYNCDNEERSEVMTRMFGKYLRIWAMNQIQGHLRQCNRPICNRSKSRAL